MRRTLLRQLACTAMFWAGLALSSSSAQSVRPSFRAGIELVGLSVSVVDREHEFIGGLSRDDFELYENGVRREVTFFGAAGVPIDVTLLLDVSGSMGHKLAIIADAAVGFVRTLRPADRAAVIGFTKRIAVLQPLTSDALGLERAIRSTNAGGRTSFYDTLYIAANELRRERRLSLELRRQVLVVLSDGQDTSSLADWNEALDSVRRSGATVFTVSPTPREVITTPSALNQRAAGQPAFTLTRLTADTGGRSYFLEDLARLPDVYTEIATEIQQQYTLGYEPDHERWGAKFRQLLVRVVPRPDAIVRTRRGYDPSR